MLKRVGPYLGEDDRIGFSGWARMAQTIDKFAVTEVRKPNVGENKPAAVTGEGVRCACVWSWACHGQWQCDCGRAASSQASLQLQHLWTHLHRLQISKSPPPPPLQPRSPSTPATCGPRSGRSGTS